MAQPNLDMWHRLIGYVALLDRNFRISSMAQPNLEVVARALEIWGATAGSEDSRNLFSGFQTRIWDYDRRLNGGFGSGRGRPCRYIGLVVLR